MDSDLPVMDALLSQPPTEENCDIARAIAALDHRLSANTEPIPTTQTHGPVFTPLRRVLATTGLGAMLIAGVTLLTSSTTASSAMEPNDASTSAFDNARSGDCLTWPRKAPDRARLVDCADTHLFEVAESVDMNNFQQPCGQAVQHYLGSRYDPNGKFTMGVLWSADQPQAAGSKLLCGLQLPGPDKQPVVFKGKVADLDQSKVWPTGTCLGIDASSQRATDAPVDCSAPHAEEITGTVNLADKFSGPPPPSSDQDVFIRDSCTHVTDQYLAPTALEATRLTLTYNTVAPASWLAGSHQVSCQIGAPDAQGWAILIGSAKDRLLINGEILAGPPPAAPAPAAPPPPTETKPAPTITQTPIATQVAATITPAPTPSPMTPSATAAVAPAVAPTPAPSAAPPPPPAEELAANVINIPGLGPITLPVWPPPPPPPPGD